MTGDFQDWWGTMAANGDCPKQPPAVGSGGWQVGTTCRCWQRCQRRAGWGQVASGDFLQKPVVASATANLRGLMPPCAPLRVAYVHK